MVFVRAFTGTPATAAHDVAACGVNDVFLVLTIQDGHPAVPAALANTQVTVILGALNQAVTTDGNGNLTLAYNAHADYTPNAVTVVHGDATRAWTATAQTNGGNLAANTRQLAPLALRGTFEVTVRVRTNKPGTGAVDWALPWTPAAPNLSHTAGAAAAVNAAFAAVGVANPAITVTLQNLDCCKAHVLRLPHQGVLAAAIAVSVDTHAGPAAANAAATHQDVTYSTAAADRISVETTRHGAQVVVTFTLDFRQVLVVGEGTDFEYAEGLSCRYGDATHANGFRWVVATQYDVTALAAVSNNKNTRHWDTGAALPGTDQRARVTTALQRNLVNHGAQFDATNAGHWAAAVVTYGPFDAVVFNNPHPGYGVEMIGLFGLVGVGGALNRRRKNGRAISVYSVGYAQALDPAALPLSWFRGLSVANRQRFDNQRTLVRGAARCNHQNAAATHIPQQWDAAHTTARAALTIDDAFEYPAGGGGLGVTTPLHANYGGAPGGAHEGIAANAQIHYLSRIDTIGLHTYLLRAYRFHAQAAVKPGGGEVFVNGSAGYAADLTQAFSFFDGAANQPVPQLADDGLWSNGDYFVWYTTNFTSARHHPSWYADVQFNPNEPNLAGSHRYRWTRP